MITTHDTALALARRLIEAFAAGDLDGLMSVVEPLEFTMEIPTAPPGAQRTLGTDDLATLVGHLGGLWTDLHFTAFEAHALLDEPGRVVAEYSTRAVNADGTVYRNRYIGLVTVRDGRVIRFEEYFDPTPLIQAIAARGAQLKATQAAAGPDARPGAG